jgi:alpha-L-arabinofuranosidase
MDKPTRWTCAAILALSLLRCTPDAPPVEANARVQITNEVIMREPPRLGVNLGLNAYYGDHQMVENAFAHGGFSQGRQALMISVKDATGNTVTDARTTPGDPDSRYVESFAGGRYGIMTGARAGEQGVITAHAAGSLTFELEKSGAPPADGDLVLLQGPWVSRGLPLSVNGEPPAGIGDFRATLDEGVRLDFVASATEERDQHLRLRFPGFDALTGGIRHYYKAVPGSANTVRLRARTEVPGVRLSVTMRHFGIPGGVPGSSIGMTANRDTNLTAAWQDFEFVAQSPQDDRLDTGLSAFEIQLTAPAGSPEGAAFLDDLSMQDAALASESGFSKPLVDRLKEARCGVLRFYGIADLASFVDDITARDTTQASWSFLSLQSFARVGNTHAVADQWFELCQTVGADPWLTIGAPNLPDDWYALISYIAAPAGFDAASARRAAHGFAEPWTTKFDTLYLEIGNEWWNGIFRPYYIEQPEQYGALVNAITARIRTHPHYDPARIKIIAGGWAINANHWNGTVDATSTHHDYVSIAPYLLHEINRFDTPEARYGTLFADVEGYARDGGRSTLDDFADNGRGTGIAVYELNTHLTGGAAPAEVASAICTSVAAGVAVLDQAMALMGKMKAAPINYFTALQRGFDSGGTRLGLWGTLLREPSGALRPRPVWHGLRLANQYLIEGDLITANVVETPTWDQSENGSVPAMDDLPYLHAYAFRRPPSSPDGAGVNVLLINRHRTLPLTTAVELPFAAAGPAKTALLSSPKISDNNENSEVVKLVEGTATPSGNTVTLTVPPFSALVCRVAQGG